jgi:hypothetical protein
MLPSRKQRQLAEYIVQLDITYARTPFEPAKIDTVSNVFQMEVQERL